jgi:uncharacterized cupredoxin-like copper-binding protein
VLALLACGGLPPTTMVRDQTLRLRLDEYRILPKHLTVRAGTIHIEARNDGNLTHNVKVFSTHFKDPQGNFVMVGGTDTVHHGETARGTVVLEPGRYRLACSLGNHDDLGQWATLDVTP